MNDPLEDQDEDTLLSVTISERPLVQWVCSGSEFADELDAALQNSNVLASVREYLYGRRPDVLQPDATVTLPDDSCLVLTMPLGDFVRLVRQALEREPGGVKARFLESIASYHERTWA